MRDEAVGSKGIVLETLCRICLRVCAAHPKIRGSPLWDVLGVTAIHSFRSAPPQLMLLLEQESWSACTSPKKTDTEIWLTVKVCGLIRTLHFVQGRNPA